MGDSDQDFPGPGIDKVPDLVFLQPTYGEPGEALFELIPQLQAVELRNHLLDFLGRIHCLQMIRSTVHDFRRDAQTLFGSYRHGNPAQDCCLSGEAG